MTSLDRSTKDCPTTIRQGFSQAKDATLAAKELYESIKQPHISLAVFFCSSDYDLDSLAAALGSHFGDVPLVGCTTAGEITPAGYLTGGLAGFSLAGPDFNAALTVIDDLANFTVSEGQAASQSLIRELAGANLCPNNDNAFAFLIIDGMSLKEEVVAAALYSGLQDILLVGGSAGAAPTKPAAELKTYVYFNGVFQDNRAVLALVNTTRPFMVFKTENFIPGETKMVITKAQPEKRKVIEINGKPAALEYFRQAGVQIDTPIHALSSAKPVGVYFRGEYYLRGAGWVHEDQSITFLCAIDEGVVLVLGKEIDFIEDLRQQFEAINARLGRPELVLACDCFSRLLQLEQSGIKERAGEIMIENNAIGFNTYGEQLDAMHMNQTLVGIAIGKAGAANQTGQSVFGLFKNAGVLKERVTERTIQFKETQEQLRKSLSLTHAALDLASDGILIVDLQGIIIDFNEKFTQLWKISPNRVRLRDYQKFVKSVAEKLIDQKGFIQRNLDLDQTPDAEAFDELHFKDGRIFECYTIPHRFGGETVGRVYSFRDITERTRFEEKLHYLTNYDHLTGLPNRRLFRDLTNHVLSQAKRHEALLAVMFVGLDRFNMINDTWGPRTGDKLMQFVVERMKGCLRSSDICARQAGDEFTIALSGIVNPDAAAMVAERLLQVFKYPFLVDENEIFISASIGITVYPLDADNIDSLLQNAYSAMRRAKELGGNNYQFFTLEMNVKAQERHYLENSLRNALENDELCLYFQPQIDLLDGALVGFEALLRWQHPVLGLLSPVKFIPLAEETGMIIPIGEWVLRKACTQWRRWEDAGLAPPRMSVNLSVRQFKQADLVEMVERIIAETQMNASMLELELTESTLMTDIEMSSQVLEKLKALGISLAIDDFGTGYSSLSYLKLLPIDTLKIDESFIRDVATNPNDAIIIQAILAMAQALGLDVLAEGVETEAQRDFLIKENCHTAQGFLFSAAVSPEQAVAWLKPPGGASTAPPV